MGHAGAIISGGKGGAQDKIAALEKVRAISLHRLGSYGPAGNVIFFGQKLINVCTFQAGVVVTRSPAQMGNELQKAMRAKHIV